MSGFESWSAPGGQRLRQTSAGLLPARRTPSWMDDIRESLRQTVSERTTQAGVGQEFVSFHESVAADPDKPYYTAINGRAAICLLLSPAYICDVEDLISISEKGGNLHFHAYTRAYPILRTVLILPSRRPLMFESPLILTNGDVQEFIIAALGTEKIELHISKTNEERRLSATCKAHRVRIVLSEAVDALRYLDHPPDDDRIQDAITLMGEDFPEFTDGLSRDTLVLLEPFDAATSYAAVELDFT